MKGRLKMKIAAAFKVVPDDQDIKVAGDRTLDYSKAKNTISVYDLNALEVAAQLAAEVEGSAAVAITAGPASIDEAKLKKSALARGVDELFMTADDACAGMDAKATAAELAKLVAQIGDVDLVVCGDGSADNYAQQVDVQLACKLGWPVVNAATKVTCKGDVLEVERTLEDAVEVVEVSLPAVVSVTPDAAEPRIPGMKDILAAGKKPPSRQPCRPRRKSSKRKAEWILMKALIIAEHAAAAAELVAGARTMADEVVAISFGGAYECGADKVLNITVPEGLTVDSAVETVNAAFDAENPEVVLVEACRHMKVIAGSLAFHADTAVITDVTAFEAEGAKSMYFGGIAERVQKAAGNVAIYTVGAGVFDGAEGANGSVAEQEWVAPARPVKVVSSQVIEKSGVNLFKADVVVAAGRGFAEESQLSLANDLCDKLGAGLACSRPLTEGVNWLPTERYVGVSGLMLTPKVYIAAGISGQMQHMVGCNRSGAIFAINKDKNAPIFKQCDFGLIGDIKDVLPAITAAL